MASRAKAKALKRILSSNNGPKDECILCRNREDDEQKYGKLIIGKNITCHYYCLLFASGLSQNGKDREGIYGFLEKDIITEVKRGSHLSCSYCRRKGATIGCINQKCRIKFHFPCGIKQKCPSLSIYRGDFRSYCADHRPVQNIKLKTCDKLCAVCTEKKDDHGDVKYHVLNTPCCKRWVHRLCVQRQALNAGKHFFKCLFCNDKDKFKKEMVKHGIYIPDQDASWERDNLFDDLLERHARCDATLCQCPFGPKYNGESRGSKIWKLLICKDCASMGIHRYCGQLSVQQNTWKCDTCKTVVKKNARES